MTNSADPEQLASSEANWSGSTLFVNISYSIQQFWKHVDCICHDYNTYTKFLDTLTLATDNRGYPDNISP